MTNLLSFQPIKFQGKNPRKKHMTFDTGKLRLNLFLFTLFCALSISAPVHAQRNNLKFTNYTIDDGLSNNYVHSIFQDRSGWMWFGTYYGLNKFDGYTFHQYYPDNSDSTSLKGRLVKEIFEDRDGNLWVGTDKGLNRYNREQDHFTSYSLIPGRELPESRDIEALEETDDGKIWIGTGGGLFFYDRKEDGIFTYSGFPGIEPHEIAVYALLTDDDDILWVGSNQGIFRLNLSNNSVVRFEIPGNNSEDPRINEIRMFFMDSKNTLWAGTYMGGLNHLNASTNRFEHFKLPEEGIKHRTVRDMIELEPGILLVATRDGMFRIDEKSGQSELIQKNPYKNNSLSHNSIWKLFKDSKGDLWVGTRGGISYLNTEVQLFSSYGALPDNDRYLKSAEIWSLLEDSRERLWIGTEDGGINILDRKNGRFSYLTTTSSELEADNIKSFCEDSRGDIWIGSFQGGLYRSPRGSGALIHYSNDSDDPASLCNDDVWSIYEDSRERVWIGTSDGLDMWNPETGNFIHYADSFRIGEVQFIMENSRREMMFASSGDPLKVYDVNRNLLSEHPYYTRGIFEDDAGNFWLGSIGGGLFKLDREFRQLENFTRKDGLCDNTVYGILEDDSGYLWISTLNGLSRFDPREERFWNFDKLDGLRNNKFNYNAFCKTRKGEMVFGGINGFDIFHPDQIRRWVIEPSPLRETFPNPSRPVLSSWPSLAPIALLWTDPGQADGWACWPLNLLKRRSR
jgi:ligand-binding sensor domain-containing protein